MVYLVQSLMALFSIEYINYFALIIILIFHMLYMENLLLVLKNFNFHHKMDWGEKYSISFRNVFTQN